MSKNQYDVSMIKKVDEFSTLFFVIQGDNRSNFEVGDELHVRCSSFSDKGIPVMSLVDNE